MLAARENSVRFLDFGFVDSAFQSPDPENQENLTREYIAVKNIPLRASVFQKTKRTIDVCVSAALLVLLFPFMLFIGCLVRLTSRGPALFTQVRLTEGGKVFRMYKFRSMRHGAEIETGPVWAEESDPRVTLIGKFLRLSHIDELPQLINVLKGEMSLIGPRPERPEMAAELQELFPNFHKRLAVKGGMTGLAQVSAGYAADLMSYREKLSLDLIYVRNRSLGLDLRIALKTIIVVLTGMGAR